ncbi:MAG: radical SAM protein [Oscillospiraceae bacterium]|nr:radical SAM protein [Oscillospiraceae bacterium]
MLEKIWEKASDGAELSQEDAVELLNISNTSAEFYTLISKANALSREQYRKEGYVFAQIGINAAPCERNCKFCSLAQDSFVVDAQFAKSAEQVAAEAHDVVAQGIDALFLMTTDDFDKEEFLRIGKDVRECVPPSVQFVANIGDFDEVYAARLKSAGFSGAYHVLRLREGEDTDIPQSTRLKTLDAIKSAGLELYYCVEPIGREHTYDEIAREMIRAREYGVNIMAIMGRVGVKGTAFEGTESLSELELTKIAAVTRLVTNPSKSMCVHEPMKMPLLAGVNQLYAEYGVSPRDTASATETGRGFNVDGVRKFLRSAEF